MSCWKRAALAVRWRAVCRLSYLIEGSGRRLVRARLHLLPFALVYGACGLYGEKCLMDFLILVFPKRIRQIFYSLAAKMCDLMVQKIMSFNLKGIVFLLGIPHILFAQCHTDHYIFKLNYLYNPELHCV